MRIKKEKLMAKETECLIARVGLKVN